MKGLLAFLKGEIWAWIILGAISLLLFVITSLTI